MTMSFQALSKSLLLLTLLGTYESFLFQHQRANVLKHLISAPVSRNVVLSTLKNPIAADTPVEKGRLEPKVKQFDFEKAWYPLAVEEFTAKTKPNPLKFLGNNIVLWFSEDGWRVFEDSCPHRRVPLSEGRVENNGELLCAYHAWTFNGDGECTSIPQTETTQKEKTLLSNPKSCVKSYPVKVEQGLIWIWGESGLPGDDCHIESNFKPLRLIEELYDEDIKDRVLEPKWNFRDIPYGWDMFMENVLDPAHVPVSHHNIVGNRYTGAKHIELKPLKEDVEAFESYPEDTGFKHETIQRGAVDDALSEDSSTEFRPPCLVKIVSELPTGGKTILALYATPTEPGFCRHIGAQVIIKDHQGKAPKGLGQFAKMPQWLMHITASLFLHQDMVFLHHQERMLYSSSNYAFGDFSANKALASTLTSDPSAYSSTLFMPNGMDKAITDFRRWIHMKAGGGVKWGAASLVNGLPKQLDSEHLFDVYNSHVKNCEICQKSFKRVLNLRNICAIVAAASAVFIRSKAKATLMTLGFALPCVILHKISRLFLKYEYSHQENE